MKDNWIGLSVRNGTLQISQRFKEIDLLAKNWNKFASPETINQINTAIHRALGAASVHLVPVKDESQFLRSHAYRKRIKARVGVSSNVGYATGETRKEIRKALVGRAGKSKYCVVEFSRTGNVTIKYSFPSNVVLKLIPRTKARFNKIKRGKSGSSGKNKVVNELEKWYKLKNIHFNGVGNKDWAKKQAFMTVNAWARDGKPQIMNDRALRISLNNAAKSAYSTQLKKEFRTISRNISKDLISKVFKNG